MSSQRFSELFFSSPSQPKFTDLQRETLNKPITEQEVKAQMDWAVNFIKNFKPC